MRIAIIGTGLSSWAVFESIKLKKAPEDSITIIDADIRYSKPSPTFGASGLKTKFGSAFPYETSGSGLRFQGQSNFSLSHGGLSNTWGAGIRLWDKEHLEFAPVQAKSIYEAARDLLQKMPYTGDESTLNLPPSLRIVPKGPPRGSNAFDKLLLQAKDSGSSLKNRTGLAVCVEGPNACRGCGQCLSGCPYGSIFESSSLFDESLRKEEFTFVKGIVRDIQKNESGTSVFYTTERQSVEFLDFDRVYLCAGAIGTPAILMRSNLLPNQVVVPDSQVFYFAGLSYFRKNQENEKFALSQVTLSSIEGEDCEYVTSLYSCNSDVRARISDLLASKFFGLPFKLPKFLDRFLFLGIGFIDSKKSGLIQLNLLLDTGEIEISSIRNPESKRVIKRALKKIAQTTRKSKMFVLSSYYQMPNPGAGFHSGASMPAGGLFVSENGSLRSQESISIADVSILPFIKPGAHTFTSMAINSAIIKNNQS
jgi:ferredoxin